MTITDAERAFGTWFTERFWPAHVQMHEQALTIVRLATGEIREPAGFVAGLVDPQPLLDELAAVPAPSMAWVGEQIREYLLAWQQIRATAVMKRPSPDGQAQFDTMLRVKGRLDDLVLKSLRGGTGYVQ